MTQSRFIRLTLFLALFLLSSFLVTAQVGVVARVERDLTMRVGAGTQWRQIAVMPVGTNVALDGRNDDGSWVRGIDQNSNIGWMFSQYLSVNADQVNALPIFAREAPITVPVPPPGDVQQPAPAAEQAAPQAQQSVPSALPAGGVSVTVTANLNVRGGPGTSYNRVGGINFNESFQLDGRDPTLSWVRGVSPSGVVGWVAVNFTNINYDQLAGLPIVDPSSPFGLNVPQAQAEQSQQAVPNVAAPPPVTSNTRITGFSYGGHVRGLDETSVNYMRIAGMTWAKVQIRYTQGQDAGSVAGVINDAHSKGFRIMLGVVGRPDQVYNGGYANDYANFVGGLAGYGADAIELWNEPNLDREWPAGRLNPADYVALLAPAYNAIKANNPNTLVISAALAPTGAEAAFPGRVVNDNNYLAGMVNAGMLNYVDCVGIHYNEGIVPPTQNSNDPRGDSYYTRFYNGMVNTYWGIIGGQRPLCFTELGYVSPEGYPPLPGGFSWASNVTVAQQAAWLDQVMSMARNSGRVRIVIVWNINFLDYGDDPMGGYAIIRPGGGCPACFALGQ